MFAVSRGLMLERPNPGLPRQMPPVDGQAPMHVHCRRISSLPASLFFFGRSVLKAMWPARDSDTKPLPAWFPRPCSGATPARCPGPTLEAACARAGAAPGPMWCKVQAVFFLEDLNSPAPPMMTVKWRARVFRRAPPPSPSRMAHGGGRASHCCPGCLRSMVTRSLMRARAMEPQEGPFPKPNATLHGPRPRLANRYPSRRNPAFLGMLLRAAQTERLKLSPGHAAFVMLLHPWSVQDLIVFEFTRRKPWEGISACAFLLRCWIFRRDQLVQAEAASPCPKKPGINPADCCNSNERYGVQSDPSDHLSSSSLP